MSGNPLDDEQLLRLAARVGSDVPFFLGPPAAVVSGKGERIRALPARGDYRMVVVWPGFPVATREAYRWLDESRGAAVGGERVESGELERRYHSLPPARWEFFNSFQEVVADRHPAIAESMEGLRRAGAEFAGLTGCGSAVFGVFLRRRAAHRAASWARRLYPLAEVVNPLQSRATGD